MFPLLFTLVAAMACNPVSSDHITGKDLAIAAAEFRLLPAAEVIAFAPAVGAKKIFGIEELARIARAHAIQPSPAAPLCFEVTAAPLDRVKVEEAIRRSLQPSDVAFEVVETSNQPAPAGELVFPRAGLSTAPSASEAPVIWRGFVRYQGGKRFDVWARVKLGAPEVRKGDVVRIEARNGAARLVLDAQALASGRLGDRIALRNPSSGKLFTATVAGRGRAVVEFPGSSE
jgi:hypothetical protein